MTMTGDRAHRLFKDRLYGQYARIGKALANAHRLEILELLAQSGRTVESLASELHLSMANASQHLQVLRAAGLVDSTRHGLFIEYRLADTSVFELCRSIRTAAEHRLAELERLVRAEFASRDDLPEPVSMDDLLARARRNEVVVLDARPADEFAAGHIPGALSIPVAELHQRLKSLPRRKEVVAYCRGPYCVYADKAVDLLRKSGRRARRLDGGFPEWRSAGFPVERSSAASEGA